MACFHFHYLLSLWRPDSMAGYGTTLQYAGTQSNILVLTFLLIEASLIDADGLLVFVETVKSETVAGSQVDSTTVREFIQTT